MVLIARHFAPPDECEAMRLGIDALIANGQAVVVLPGRVKRYSGRVDVYPTLRDVRSAVIPVITALRERIIRSVKDHFLLERELFAETTLFSVMDTGASVPLHADNERKQAAGWGPNHTSWCDFAAILYLGTCGVEFSGGELVFPNKGITAVPETGTLVAFPCGHEFEHEVREVTTGRRQAIYVWMTFDAGRAEWPISQCAA